MTAFLGWGLTPQSLTNVTPFTYRDNATYLQILQETRNKVNDMIAAINTNAGAESADVAAINAQYTTLVAQWNTTLATLDPTAVNVLVSGVMGSVNTAVADVATLTTQVNTAVADVATLTTDTSTNTTDITTLNTTVATMTATLANLNNVDNTSDINKPLSTAAITALAFKLDTNAVDSAFSAVVPGPSLSNTALNNLFKRDSRDIREFGGVGDGIADETIAFNAAIAYANSLGGNDRGNVLGCTIVIPDGKWKLPTSLNPIVVSGVHFEGSSREGCVLQLATGANSIFTFGDSSRVHMPVGFSMSNMRVEYVTSPAVGDSAVFLKIDYGFETVLENLLLVSLGTLVQCGTSATNIAGGVTLHNIRGSVANAGIPTIVLNFGAGLVVSDCGLFVSGVLPPVHPANMTTKAGTNFIQAYNSNWDTVLMDNSIIERYDGGVSCVTGSGSVFQNAFITNCIFDFLADDVIHLESVAGGVISTVRTKNTWFNSWSKNCVYMVGPGYNDYHVFEGVIAQSGASAVFYGITNAKHNIFSLIIASNNRLGTGNGALSFQTGSKGFIITNCVGNENNGAGTFQNDWGVYIGADSDEYAVIGNKLSGAAGGGYNIAANTGNSTKRRVSNNIGTGYVSGAAFTLAASGVANVNMSAFTWEINVYGGTVTGISKNGLTLGATSGTLRIDPGGSFTVTYSVAPTVTQFVLA